MISIRRLVKLHEQGQKAHEIAAQHDIPVAMIWRELLYHYKRKYLAGAATVADAERRIAKAEASARRAWEATARAEEEAREAQHRATKPEREWRARLMEVARESSPGRRLEIASTPLDRELPPARVVDLRTAKDLEA